MKHKPEIYAEAFSMVLSENKETEGRILKNFLRVVRKNGDWVGILKIFRAVESRFVKNHGGRMVLVESARNLPENTKKEFLKSFSAKGGFASGGKKEDKIEFINNSNIVAGARVTIDGERELDFSFRRKLNKLFKP